MFFFSCASNGHTPDSSKPERLISQQTFNNLLFDMYIIEAKYYRNSISTLHLDSLTDLQVSLFDSYNTDYKSFKSSYDYYHTLSDVSSKMYQEMIDSLLVLESKQSIEEEEQIDSEAGLVRDSVHAH